MILGVVYFNGGKSCQNCIKLTWENLFHRYSARGKSFETGRVPANFFISCFLNTHCCVILLHTFLIGGKVGYILRIYEASFYYLFPIFIYWKYIWLGDQICMISYMAWPQNVFVSRQRNKMAWPYNVLVSRQRNKIAWP